jgi:hypothetical protein
MSRGKECGQQIVEHRFDLVPARSGGERPVLPPQAGNAGLSAFLQFLGGPTSKPAGEVSLRLGETDAGRQLQLPLASSAASSSSTSMVAIAEALSLMA